MMRISHTRRSRSPVTHPKTPVDSTTRPIPAAAPRKRAPTLHYKSHPSYSSHHWFLPTKPPLSWFLQGLGFNPASPMLFGNVAVQKVAPSFLVSTFCPSIMPPSPRDGQPLLLNRPGQESRGRGHHHFSFGPCSAETLAQCGHMVIGKSLLL